MPATRTGRRNPKIDFPHWHFRREIVGQKTQSPATAAEVAPTLLSLPSGEVVVIDHKSSAIRPEPCATKAATFGGQLAAYRAALAAQGFTVAGTWIHFPLAAAVIRMELAPEKTRAE